MSGERRTMCLEGLNPATRIRSEVLVDTACLIALSAAITETDRLRSAQRWARSKGTL